MGVVLSGKRDRPVPVLGGNEAVRGRLSKKER